MRHKFTYLAVYVALCAAFCWPLFADPAAAGSGDWDQHLFYYASVLRNAAFGQWPLWNPWYCGGNVLWANPQVSLVSPVYLLALVMPLALAMKLNIVGHYVLGCVGMHLVLRRIVGVRSPFVLVYLVCLFVFSGAMAMHLAAGHSDFLSVFWLPLLVYCFWRAIDGHVRSVLFGGAVLGFTILNGGPHAVPLAAVLLGALGCGAIATRRSVKPLLLAMAIVALGCVYAAPKLVPGALLLRSTDFHDTRPVKHPDAMSVPMLAHALFDASQGTATRLNRDVQLYGWQEYGNYLGWFGAGLILITGAWILVFRWRPEYWIELSVAVASVLILLLTAGEFASWSPASVMNHLPFFSSFRIPSRHIILLPLVGSICVAFAVRVLESGSRFKTWRLAVDVICLVGVCQLALVNRAHFRDAFVLPPIDAESRLFERGDLVVAAQELPGPGPAGVLRTNMVGSMLAGVSPLNCWEPLQMKKVAQPGPATIVLAGVSAGVANAATLTDAAFSPNRISATATVGPQPARVVLNQNFAEGWTSNLGAVDRDPDSGRPSVVLPAGYTGTVAFSYTTPGLWLGLIIFAVAVAVSIWVWRFAAA